MVLLSRRERCIQILYTPFLLLYVYDFEWKSENFRKNLVLMSQRERCIHILYTPFLLLYNYYFEWNSENLRKYGSLVATGTVYTNSVYTVPVTIWL